MKIYICDIQKTDLNTLFKHKYTDFLVELKNINSLKRTEDKKRSLGAGLLLLEVLENDYGIDFKYACENLKKTVNGKPYLQNGEAFFNISHSGDYIMLAVDENEVGADIERIRIKNDRVVDRCFSEGEIRLLEDDIVYTTIWTLKESYVKLKGVGIAVDLKNVDTEYRLEKKYYCNRLKVYYVTSVIGDYCFSVCSNNVFEYDIIDYNL